MFLSHYLLLLFLLALQTQNAQSAPTPGQGAVVDTARTLSAPELEPNTMLIPSWYLKRNNYDKVPEEFPEGFPDVSEELLNTLDEAPSETDSETVLETFPMEENGSLPGSDEEREPTEDTSTLAEPGEYSWSAAGQKAKTAGQWEFSKNYILASVAVSALLLLAAVVGYIIMYQLLKRDIRTQEDKEATRQDWDSTRESCGLPRCEAESSCRLFPEVFAAELAQVYKNMGTDRSPLPTCSFCALADGASSRDHWISLDSPQPTPFWCPCYQYQQEHFILEDND
ncbi:uncharacterized protein LOC128822634 isoform X1 [Vidua macroura]|uniref:uncharacterized protein LOC128822634 isoform X1 n=1 Tax=Vidua macroura TaxID=187451 RepID=UPI0023A865DC|nr:uncharacterized protein LOC128822634 isoform X1 [Vidua macroura]